MTYPGVSRMEYHSFQTLFWKPREIHPKSLYLEEKVLALQNQAHTEIRNFQG